MMWTYSLPTDGVPLSANHSGRGTTAKAEWKKGCPACGKHYISEHLARELANAACRAIAHDGNCRKLAKSVFSVAAFCLVSFWYLSFFVFCTGDSTGRQDHLSPTQTSPFPHYSASPSINLKAKTFKITPLPLALLLCPINFALEGAHLSCGHCCDEAIFFCVCFF